MSANASQRQPKENPYIKMRKYKGNNLQLIVDLNTCYWLEKKSLGLEGLLVLISQTMNSHLIKSIYNSVYVFVVNSRDSKMIFPLNNSNLPNQEEQEDNDQNRIDNMDYGEIQRRIQKRVVAFMQSNMADNINYSRTIPAITQALCKINKFSIMLEKKQASQIENEKYFSSILILSVSEIHSSSYTSLMSAIETSIKNKVTIYVLELPVANLSKNTSDYFRQLCSLTSGYYAKIKDEGNGSQNSVNPLDIVNYISILMLTSGDMIAKPEQQLTDHCIFRPAINEKVQFRVNCSCHNTPMETDKAYVCSDCLFLYCKQNEKHEEVCSNCAHSSMNDN